MTSDLQNPVLFYLEEKNMQNITLMCSDRPPLSKQTIT